MGRPQQSKVWDERLGEHRHYVASASDLPPVTLEAWYAAKVELPDVLEGDVWEHVGSERGVSGSGKRIQFISVPGGRRTVYRYVLVDPPSGGNGRPRRTPISYQPDHIKYLVRNSRLVERGGQHVALNSVPGS